jgi:hypothetical protein
LGLLLGERLPRALTDQTTLELREDREDAGHRFARRTRRIDRGIVLCPRCGAPNGTTEVLVETYLAVLAQPFLG